MKADIELPQALEKVLAFKNVRAQELGVSNEGGKAFVSNSSSRQNVGQILSELDSNITKKTIGPNFNQLWGRWFKSLSSSRSLQPQINLKYIAFFSLDLS